jgi:hypothetical protein
VSLNTVEEIEALRPITSGVDFSQIPKDRTRPLITDFFGAAKSCRNTIVGIINSDCMIIPQFNARPLNDHLSGIVIAERLNLSPETLQVTAMSGGFDAFFFRSTALAAVEHDHHWRIGDVWYDYWLPLAFHAAGLEIKTLPAPMLLHLNHDQGWEWSACVRHFPRLINLFEGKAHLIPHLSTELPRGRKLRSRDVHKISNLLYVWLTSHETLWYPEPGSQEEFTTFLLNALAKQPPADPYLNAVRPLFRRTIDTLGLRRTLYALGLVKSRDINS